ncbi:cytochrome P450 [Alternaria alternata]|nr:cytochrome P450 [Alternaria alternata]
MGARIRIALLFHHRQPAHRRDIRSKDCEDPLSQERIHLLRSHGHLCQKSDDPQRQKHHIHHLRAYVVRLLICFSLDKAALADGAEIDSQAQAPQDSKDRAGTERCRPAD